MVLALTAKKRIGFVNGKIVKPEIDSPLYEDWESCNTMVLSWLISSMHVDVEAASCTVRLRGRCGLSFSMCSLSEMDQRSIIFNKKFTDNSGPIISD